MRRRFFVAASAAGFFAPRIVIQRKPRRRKPGRRQRGVVLIVRRPPNWLAWRWSDVPPAGEILTRFAPLSLASARLYAKLFNRRMGDLGAGARRRWAIVVTTDGRLARQTKGGAA